MESPPRQPRRDYARGLPDHLRALAARARAIREQELLALTAPGPVHRRQAWVRETLWRLAGGEPERSALGLRTTGMLERPGYRLEKLVYESRLGFHVTANLYIPAGRRGPFPGVLFQCGHLPAGKGAASYQRACQALAARGHVVLVFDPVGQGERIYYPAPGSPLRSRLGLSDAEHDRAGEQLLLAGETATGLLLWDAVRSLDVLASHPDVDPARLASAGQSGGGTLTMLLAAADDRLAAAVVACGNTENLVTAAFEPPGSTDDAEQNLVGAGPLGLDRWDLLLPLAPRPLLLLVSTEDPSTTYSPAYLADGRAEAARLAQIYAVLNRPEALRWVETEEPHGLTSARRLEMTRWLGRWLLGEDGALDEADLPVEPEDATWATPGGNAVRALGGRRPVDLARARLETRWAGRADAATLLPVERPTPGLCITELETVPSWRCTVTEVEVRSAPEVWVPARILEPTAGAPRAILLAIGGARDPRWVEDATWPRLAHAGWAVCAADARGVGSMAPEVSPGAPDYVRAHANEESYAWASLVLGESLLAQRVADVLALVEALAAHPRLGGRPLAVAARETLAIPALFAAALEPRIGLLYLDGALGSFRSLLDTEDPAFPLGGIAAAADLPSVAALVSPRPIVVAGPMDGSGASLLVDAARALYREAPSVTVLPSRGWDFDALAAVLHPWEEARPPP
jgi:dienelactone hydrolase